MLFTTTAFVFAFLPIVLAGYFLFGRFSAIGAAAWLFLASLFFYAYWMPEFTLLLLGSIAFNFHMGGVITRARASGARVAGLPLTTAALSFAITIDLALLAYFKYANFFVENLQALTHTRWEWVQVILPIGISFYTFTQIAYLVDAWAGKVQRVGAVHYGLFVTYFPHLIAGPVLHYGQMIPQFERREVYRFDSANFVAGLAVFSIGLFKKIVLADGVAPYADAAFGGADAGSLPTPAEAWVGALAYTAQLYFDFSGYSDMAIGLSRMFNVELPINFNSPYKSLSISDFWRRWHITLSTFLRDYLYFPLGGNRKGVLLRYVNLTITMVLGGLWHGASWLFVAWGTLHGLYLVVNHGYRAAMEKLGWSERLDRSRAFALFAWLLTFLAVVLAWVLFRAHTLDGALRMLHGMAGANPAGVNVLFWNQGLHIGIGALWCAVLLAAAVFLPNSNHIGTRLHELSRRSVSGRAALAGASAVAMLFLVLVNATRESVSAFIYFNF